MELNKKLQELRKQKGLTQEELAAALYVSRTAVSKWESGRGYPNIDSLKAIARFFGITVDELLSGEELLTLAETDMRQKETRVRDLVYGLLDISAALLLFLPLFATQKGGELQNVSLIASGGMQLYLKVAYLIGVIGMIVVGLVTLALQSLQSPVWLKYKGAVSLILGTAFVLLFIISSQPYAASLAFVLLMIKMLMAIKRP